MPASALTNYLQQYGYGTAPGTGPGYYEQQTPAGSFAAADVRSAGPTATANNPYLGMSSAVGGGSAGQAMAGNNPYFGQSNPYTGQAVAAASQAAGRQYNQLIAPQRDAQMARSGSFGNTGVQQMQLEDQRNLQNTLGNIANNAYMQDLYRQQDMGEAAANRATSTSQFNVGARAGDLNRNLGAIQFDARLAGEQGMFNAGQSNAMSMFDAGQQNNTNQFNAGAGNAMLEAYRNRAQQQGQFDATLDYNIDNSNFARQMAGLTAGLNIYDRMLNNTSAAYDTGTNVQNTPLNYWGMFNNGFNGLAGNGGSTSGTVSNPYFGNPLMGFVGGYNLLNGLGGA